MTKWAIVLSLGLIGSAVAFQGGYVGEQKRAIKALSETDIEGLREGRGMGLAKVAELNSFPGPMHVLEHAEALKITDAQRKKIEASMATMRVAAKSLGKQIIDAEAALDEQFKKAKADPKQVGPAMEKIGRMHGQLRWAHLKAHIETRAILNKVQIAKYDELRGYTEAK